MRRRRAAEVDGTERKRALTFFFFLLLLCVVPLNFSLVNKFSSARATLWLTDAGRILLTRATEDITREVVPTSKVTRLRLMAGTLSTKTLTREVTMEALLLLRSSSNIKRFETSRGEGTRDNNSNS